jgi:hypothetical protein
VTDPIIILATALAAVAAVAIIAIAGLKGWHGWLELQRTSHDRRDHPMTSTAGSRIELADLRERVRKLEAIAAGVEL